MVFYFFAARLWKRIFCIVSVLLKRIGTGTMQKINFQSNATFFGLSTEFDLTCHCFRTSSRISVLANASIDTSDAKMSK